MNRSMIINAPMKRITINKSLLAPVNLSRRKMDERDQINSQTAIKTTKKPPVATGGRNFFAAQITLKAAQAAIVSVSKGPATSNQATRLCIMFWVKGPKNR